MDLRVGNLKDGARLRNCLDYLYKKIIGDRDTYKCSIKVNGFVEMTLYYENRKNCFHVLLVRESDQCRLHRGIYPDCEHLVDSVIYHITGIFSFRDEFHKCISCQDLVELGQDSCSLCALIKTYHEDTCAICLDEARGKAMWIQLPCNHVFHHDCIHKAKDDKTRCPLCRTDFMIKDMKVY